MKRSIVTLAAALWLAGCTVYHARPIDPAKRDAAFRSRTLSDPPLLRYVQSHTRQAPTQSAPEAWDVNTLTLAALYYRADFAAACAEATTAEAGIRTAGALPNPTIGVGPGYESEPQFPFIIDVTLDWPIETGGKRERRVDQAKAIAAAARWGVAQAAWETRSRVRAALLEYVTAQRAAESAGDEAKARAEAVELLSQRLAAGGISRPELDRARLDLNNVQLASQTAQGRVSDAQAKLAAAVGVPVEALQQVRVNWPDLDHLPAEGALPPLLVQQAALRGRADVRKALSEYAGTEAALHLEIAKQYPDFQISPGYAFEEGIHKYKLGASLTLPLLNQNQGPVAEAEGRRASAAARFDALQADVIGQCQQSLARYRSALAVLKTANQILASGRQRREDVQAAFDVGRADRVGLTDAEVEVAAASTGQIEALRSAQAALGELEDSLQRPLSSPVSMTFPAEAQGPPELTSSKRQIR